MSSDAFLLKTDWVMVLANIVQRNITTLILILPNGPGLVILYTMKYEIQSVYRALIVSCLNRAQWFLKKTRRRQIWCPDLSRFLAGLLKYKSMRWEKHISMIGTYWSFGKKRWKKKNSIQRWLLTTAKMTTFFAKPNPGRHRSCSIPCFTMKRRSLT